MAKRKAISKKDRFEVFKRDHFTCQYCGRRAPDVVLHVDHIDPVANGGTNEITNLITACSDCNGGKGARLLDDHTATQVKMAGIEELAERREQLEMIYEWQKELLDAEEKDVDLACGHIVSLSTYEPNEVGRAEIHTLIVKYGLDEVIESIKIAFAKYYMGGSNSWNFAFKKIGGICTNRAREREEQWQSSITTTTP